MTTRRQFLKRGALFVPATFGIVRAVSQAVVGRPMMPLQSAGGSNGLLTGLTAYWPLDESSDGSAPVTREDAHSTYDLTDNNTTASASGKINNGADFEFGNTEYLSRTADDAGLSIGGTTSVSISAWANLESAGASRIVVSKALAGTSTEYILFYSNTTSGWRFGIGRTGSATVDYADGPASVSTGVWYHLVGVFDPAADTIVLYIDTTAYTTTGKTINPDDTGSFLRIGAQGSGGTNPFDGIIDEVALWRNRVLSSSDVAALYNSGNGLAYGSFTA